jgi:hypothetical protein
LAKSSFRCGNSRYGHDPDAGNQPVLVQAEDFAESTPYPVANDCMTYAPGRDDSEPSCALACLMQDSQGEVPSSPGFSVFFDESEFGRSS